MSKYKFCAVAAGLIYISNCCGMYPREAYRTFEDQESSINDSYSISEDLNSSQDLTKEDETKKFVFKDEYIDKIWRSIHRNELEELSPDFEAQGNSNEKAFEILSKRYGEALLLTEKDVIKALLLMKSQKLIDLQSLFQKNIDNLDFFNIKIPHYCSNEIPIPCIDGDVISSAIRDGYCFFIYGILRSYISRYNGTLQEEVILSCLEEIAINSDANNLIGLFINELHKSGTKMENFVNFYGRDLVNLAISSQNYNFLKDVVPIFVKEYPRRNGKFINADLLSSCYSARILNLLLKYTVLNDDEKIVLFEDVISNTNQGNRLEVLLKKIPLCEDQKLFLMKYSYLVLNLQYARYLASIWGISISENDAILLIKYLYIMHKDAVAAILENEWDLSLDEEEKNILNLFGSDLSEPELRSKLEVEFDVKLTEDQLYFMENFMKYLSNDNASENSEEEYERRLQMAQDPRSLMKNFRPKINEIPEEVIEFEKTAENSVNSDQLFWSWTKSEPFVEEKNQEEQNIEENLPPSPVEEQKDVNKNTTKNVFTEKNLSEKKSFIEEDISESKVEELLARENDSKSNMNKKYGFR